MKFHPTFHRPLVVSAAGLSQAVAADTTSETRAIELAIEHGRPGYDPAVFWYRDGPHGGSGMRYLSAEP